MAMAGMVTNRRFGLRVAGLAATVLMAGQLLAGELAVAQALLSDSAVRAKLESEWGVQVLRLVADEQDGAPVFVVRVMNPGGNYNEAFQVTVLVVDRLTGDLVPQFRHGPSGVRGAGGVRSDANENSGPTLRRESVR